MSRHAVPSPMPSDPSAYSAAPVACASEASHSSIHRYDSSAPHAMTAAMAPMYQRCRNTTFVRLNHAPSVKYATALTPTGPIHEGNSSPDSKATEGKNNGPWKAMFTHAQYSVSAASKNGLAAMLSASRCSTSERSRCSLMSAW